MRRRCQTIDWRGFAADRGAREDRPEGAEFGPLAGMSLGVDSAAVGSSQQRR